MHLGNAIAELRLELARLDVAIAKLSDIEKKMRVGNAIAELRLELARVDVAIANLSEHLRIAESGSRKQHGAAAWEGQSGSPQGVPASAMRMMAVPPRQTKKKQ